MNEVNGQYVYSFLGIGAEKYSVKDTVDRLGHADIEYFPLLNGSRSVSRNNGYTMALASALTILDSRRDKISKTAYEIMKADFVGSFGSKMITALMMWNWIPKTWKPDSSFFGYSQNIELSEQACELSLEYANYEMYRFFGLCFFKSDSGAYDRSFEYAKKCLSGPLRDKTLTIFIERKLMLSNTPGHMLKEALPIVTDPYWHEHLEELARATSTSYKGHGFKLYNEENGIVNLDSFSNKVVFIDFWFTGCANCWNFYTNVLSKVEDYFKHDTNIVFVTVSIDQDINVWRESLKSGMYTGERCVNLYTGGRGLINPLLEYYRVAAFPHPMIFDRGGGFVEKGNLRVPAEVLQEKLRKVEIGE
jgi:hypothetical protein